MATIPAATTLRLLCLQAGCCSTSAAPSVFYILVDDLGSADVSFNVQPRSTAPSIDLLADACAAMTSFYTHSECAPSRAALLSSCYKCAVGFPFASSYRHYTDGPKIYDDHPHLALQRNYTSIASAADPGGMRCLGSSWAAWRAVRRSTFSGRRTQGAKVQCIPRW